ncbi:hypothetical protein BCL69_10618 [Nitrosomonas communis]|uniref:Uncharacterized protein n=1 Tax=Nitrosomonas communis TaxID=44574 RepID=A0A5D3YB83_9PROT|nr:hypothetical protein BCL69_10618 [Nitrosomonas communis]
MKRESKYLRTTENLSVDLDAEFHKSIEKTSYICVCYLRKYSESNYLA